MAGASAPLSRSQPSLLALGFRPFFLAAGTWAPVSVAIWLGMLHGRVPAQHYYGGIAWHAHALLFGYGTAVIAGFLLTAVRNWTGIATPTGIALAALASLWLAGRVAPVLPLPGVLVAATDLAFLPALALALLRPLWQGENRTNRVFLVLLAGMTLANLLVHAQALGLAAGTAALGLRLMLDLTLVTLLIVAGRVMPFFTERAAPGARPVSWALVERLTFVIAPAAAGANLVAPWSVPSGCLAIALAAIQAVRLWGWHDPRVWSRPILAVLYSGYLWLILGLALDGLAGFGLLPPYPSLHALTVGAIGVFTLGMMARVTMGHTGREMRSTRLANLGFILVNGAALVRVAPAIVAPASYGTWLSIAGGLWIGGFACFLWVYAPMLVAPRVDGRPG